MNNYFDPRSKAVFRNASLDQRDPSNKTLTKPNKIKFRL